MEKQLESCRLNLISRKPFYKGLPCVGHCNVTLSKIVLNFKYLKNPDIWNIWKIWKINSVNSSLITFELTHDVCTWKYPVRKKTSATNLFLYFSGLNLGLTGLKTKNDIKLLHCTSCKTILDGSGHLPVMAHGGFLGSAMGGASVRCQSIICTNQRVCCSRESKVN